MKTIQPHPAPPRGGEIGQGGRKKGYSKTRPKTGPLKSIPPHPPPMKSALAKSTHAKSAPPRSIPPHPPPMKSRPDIT